MVTICDMQYAHLFIAYYMQSDYFWKFEIFNGKTEFLYCPESDILIQ